MHLDSELSITKNITTKKRQHIQQSSGWGVFFFSFSYFRYVETDADLLFVVVVIVVVVAEIQHTTIKQRDKATQQQTTNSSNTKKQHIQQSSGHRIVRPLLLLVAGKSQILRNNKLSIQHPVKA